MPQNRRPLPPHFTADSRSDSPSQRAIRVYSRPCSFAGYTDNVEYPNSTGNNSPLAYTIRRRPTDKEDRRWQESRSASPSIQAVHQRHESEKARHSRPQQRPALAVLTRPPPSNSAASAPISVAGPTSAGSTGGASRSGSTSSRCSSLASDYLYGHDFVYGAEPVRPLPHRSVTIDPTAVTVKGLSGNRHGRRVRFDAHYV